MVKLLGLLGCVDYIRRVKPEALREAVGVFDV